jgi:hypothetical protein
MRYLPAPASRRRERVVPPFCFERVVEPFRVRDFVSRFFRVTARFGRFFFFGGGARIVPRHFDDPQLHT